jgi:hypothetical protein
MPYGFGAEEECLWPAELNVSPVRSPIHVCAELLRAAGEILHHLTC